MIVLARSKATIVSRMGVGAMLNFSAIHSKGFSGIDA